MNHALVLGLLAAGAISLLSCWLAWQLLRQNGRILLRLDALERSFEPSKPGDESGPASLPIASPTRDFKSPAQASPARRELAAPTQRPVLKRIARWPVAVTAATLRWLMLRLASARASLDDFELRHFRFKPRADDIFIVTYPRSGTTWMQMILYQLTTDGSMSLGHIAEHSPWFEQSPDSADGFEECAGPRVFKSHLPFKRIPKGPGRYIYVARDGRDVAVSYYHLYRSHNGYVGTFDEFFELFLCGNVMFGSWFKHVEGWYTHRHKLNVLFLTYEELMADLEGCLRRIIAFCHLTVPEERLPLIVERCGFAFMKQHENKFDPAAEALSRHQPKQSLFVRAGRVGEGYRQLSKQQQVRFDQALQARLRPPPVPAELFPRLGPDLPGAPQLVQNALKNGLGLKKPNKSPFSVSELTNSG
jgi:hypothetical protein